MFVQKMCIADRTMNRNLKNIRSKNPIDTLLTESSQIFFTKLKLCRNSAIKFHFEPGLRKKAEFGCNT